MWQLVNRAGALLGQRTCVIGKHYARVVATRVLSCVAFCVSLALVIGSLIHLRVSSSQVCRMMAWSGVGTRSGGTARYHVGGMYPRSASMARSSHSRHDWLAGAGAMARSRWWAWCSGCSRSQWSGLKSPEVLVQQV